jgi:dTDP-4-dehydrorhamnose reductase
MLGRAVSEHCHAKGDEVLSAVRAELDITDVSSVLAILDDFRPEVVINCAAWTDVDGCEIDPKRAFLANAQGPENLAIGSRRVGASLITISTDYVFKGDKEGFYTQRDDPDAISVYGRAKIEGERRAQAACARTSIVRTGWIFGNGGRNFLSRVVESGARGNRVPAICDAYGTPTYSVDLASRLRHLAEIDLPGVYHVVNAGPGTTFEGFAREVFHIAGFDQSMIDSVPMSTLNRPAPRPYNSRLRCLLSEAIGLAPMPDWRLSVADFVAGAPGTGSAQG